ncbi:MAG: glutamine ABC transporter ATP-binding protein GlnQ, partial [Verrucomicrobiales bacterium]|nr:glutamine ABC transporter ATP-binding protein GlnQ [Verrucomicrobiales bacterium]
RGGQEIILSTHEMGFARAAADEVVFLADGKLVESGSAEQLFGDARDNSVQRFLSRVMRW